MALVRSIGGRFSPSLNCACRLIDRRGEPRGTVWLGQYGERVAAAHLRKNGCSILQKNFRGRRKGEVDIIARQGKLLLFVEVKTRHEGGPIRAYDAVTKDKQALIKRGADAWLKAMGTRKLPWRFDVIEIYVSHGERPRVNHIRDAF